MRKTIAIATCREYPALVADDQPLVGMLAAAGVDASPVLWNDTIEWRRFDGVLLRSPWDYFLHIDAFRAWLDLLDRDGVPCWNSTALVRWNLDKRYLRELASKGVATVPTLWLERDGATAESASARILATGWPEVVVKPAVSAGAWETARLRREDVPARAAWLDSLLARDAVLVQPFVPEVVTHGEYSFLFFDGEFSHAALKRAKDGDFRVQWTHGGTQVGVTVSPGLLSQARSVVAAAPSPGLYARVDGVVRDGRLLLMELEQIEPYLFFENEPAARERFVAAVRKRLGV